MNKSDSNGQHTPTGTLTPEPGPSPRTRLARTALLIGMDRSAPTFVAGLQEEGVQTLVIDRLDDVLDAADRFRPDLVLMRWDAGEAASNSPHSHLIEALRRQRGVGRILVLLPSADLTTALTALERGADDVIPPPHSVETVLLRARLAQARLNLLPIYEFRTIQVDPKGERVMDADGSIPLTGRENELLTRLIEARGNPVSRDHLLVDIWGGEQESVAVLDATVHRLRRKLEANPANPKILTTVRGVGYRLEMARVEMV